jgi:hypothetical protein
LPKSDARVITAPTGPSIADLNRAEFGRREEASAARRANLAQGGGVNDGLTLLSRTPGDETISPKLKGEALKTRIEESAPGEADLSFASGVGQQAAEAISGTRHLLGLSKDFTTPQPTSAIGRGVKRFGHALGRLNTPLNVGGFIASQIPNNEVATFKPVSMNDIVSRPELLERWDALTDQQKAFVTFDGTNKAYEALTMTPKLHERLYGSVATKTLNDRMVQTRTGGIAGRQLDAQAAAATRPTSASGVGASTGETQPPQRAALGPGEQESKVVLDTTDKEEYVYIGPNMPGMQKNRSFMLTPDQAAKNLNSPNPSIRLSRDDPFEVARFLDLASAEIGEIVVTQMTNRQFRSLPADQQAQKIRMSGDQVDARWPSGAVTSVPEEMFELYPALRREEKRGLIPVVDTRTNKEMFKTETEIRQAPDGTYIPSVERSAQEITTREIERKTDSRASLILTGELMQLLRKSGAAGLAWPGRVGTFLGKIMLLTGNKDAADSLQKMFSGGDLTVTEAGLMRKGLNSWVSGRREAILADTRISNFEREILQNAVSLADGAANPEEVEEMMTLMMMVELTHNELKLWAAREPQQFPVDSDENAARTWLELVKFGFPGESADKIIRTMGKYWELNGEPAPEGFQMSPGGFRP